MSQYQCVIDYEIPAVNEKFPHLTMHWIGYFEGDRRNLDTKVKECLQALRRDFSAEVIVMNVRLLKVAKFVYFGSWRHLDGENV